MESVCQLSWRFARLRGPSGQLTERERGRKGTSDARHLMQADTGEEPCRERERHGRDQNFFKQRLLYTRREYSGGLMRSKAAHPCRTHHQRDRY